MNNEQTDYCSSTANKTLLWSAVFGGVLSSVGVGILLSLLGFGLALFKADTDTLAMLGTGTVVWIVVSGLIAMFTCGWVASYCAKTCCLLRGSLHGLLAWALATVLGLAVINSGVGMLVSGAGQLIGKTLSVAGNSLSVEAQKALAGVGLVSEGQTKQLKDMMKQVGQLLKQEAQQKSGIASSDDVVDAVLNPNSEVSANIKTALQDYLSNTDQGRTDALRQAVVEQLVKHTRLNKEQAVQVVNQWQQRYQKATETLQRKAKEAQAKAKEMAEAASTQLSKAAFAAFFTLLLGALVAVAGAAVAVRGRRYQKTEGLL